MTTPQPRTQALLLASTLAASIAAGCSSMEKVNAPYRDVPQSCDAIQAEMDGISESIARTMNLRSGKDAAIAMITLGVATGLVSPVFAFVPPVLKSLRLSTPYTRLDYLAQAKLHRGCKTAPSP